jgi:predicted nucleic acid-binding protein
MAAGKRSFSAALGPVVYWDASFAIPYLFEEEPYHHECCDFVARLRSEEALSVFSDFGLNEVAFWAVKGALIDEARRAGCRWIDAKRQRPELVTAALADFAPKRRELEERTLKLTIPDTVTDRAFQLMHDFALLPTDAYHLATGLENGVEAFVTLDQDFLAVDDIIVYTCLR